MDGKVEVVIVIHVDDILATSKTAEAIDRFIGELGQKIFIKDLGTANFYMGCHISRDRSGRKLRLGQDLYVQLIADRFEVTKTSMIPAAAGVMPLSRKGGLKTPEEEVKMRGILYRVAVGALM